MIKAYTGIRDDNDQAIVYGPNGERLDPRLDLVGHSPTGFDWGYGAPAPLN